MRNSMPPSIDSFCFKASHKWRVPSFPIRGFWLWKRNCVRKEIKDYVRREKKNLIRSSRSDVLWIKKLFTFSIPSCRILLSVKSNTRRVEWCSRASIIYSVPSFSSPFSLEGNIYSISKEEKNKTDWTLNWVQSKINGYWRKGNILALKLLIFQ